MNNEIFLSIIIPIYNSEKYLRECINSILLSDYKNIEIILINDGSADNSKKIMEDFSKIDKRITIMNQENSGVSLTRNKGINKAKGKYIMFVDSDDILEENWDNIIKHIKEKDIYYFTNAINKSASKQEMLRFIIGNNDDNICFAGPFSKVFKKELLEKNNILFNSKLINGEDMLFNVSALLNSNDFEIINYSFYNYRNFVGSATKKFKSEIFESDMLFHKELEKVLKENKISCNVIEEIKMYCLQTAVVMLLQRLTFIKRYKDAKKHYKIFFQEPYLSAINNKFVASKKFWILLKLLKLKCTMVLYFCLKIFQKIKYNSKNNEGYYFVKI